MTTTLAVPPASGSAGYEDLTGTYAVDPRHSRLGFVARHAMVTKVRGRFDEFEGTIHVDGSDPSRSSAEVRIAVASIDTRLAVRDEHLRSNDFLGAQQHPFITYRTTRVEQLEPTTFRVTGDLTIKGTTRPVVLDMEFTGAATDTDGDRRIGFEGTTTIDRRDWGINWNATLETGGVLVSNLVTLEIDVSAVRTG
ncbi:YceI family protein [Blastococcus deserti]|uniref:YceI family protein n=1 Tax=Blastococcus deserti TaxID=2259033 RepID=A0ABW4X969_9ACTN